MRRCETVGNRLVGVLHGCLLGHTAYDEMTAWGHWAELDLLELLDTLRSWSV